jgi:predicted ATPase/class 3 adenylate cyclase/Tfp pilus assembly protein PilF
LVTPSHWLVRTALAYSAEVAERFQALGQCSAAIVSLEGKKEDVSVVASPPTGTVTFLFTDIEGSTKRWERHPEVMQTALVRHDEILTVATEQHGGYVFKTVGDAFCCAFPTAPDALKAALDAQRLLLKERWGESNPLKVRMALHMGVAEEREGDYFGPPVNRVARLLSAAHGGQVLLSLPTHEMVRDQLPARVSLRDLGEHHLKDLFRPERVFQLVSPDMPSEFPPLRTLDAYRNNLPLQPTPLIGREKEAAEVCDLLRRDETRLLTLTGPGGTGKTRLALQAAADLLEDFPDGAFFTPLATVTEAELFLSAIAETLGVRETGEQPLFESLKDYLGEKRQLLVPDNFEQVLGAAPTVTELLAVAPGLKVLATSRAPLGLYGEHEFPVPPLTLPDLKHPPPLESLTQYEAVGLFLERARAVKPDFTITNESAPAVAEICVRLDGLPLAIELAAARIKMLPPRAMLQRLTSRLKLLTGGARDLPERQRTLRGAIEWSHALLDEGEQVLFARLAVFSGGRTLEAIEAVCEAGGDLGVNAFEGVSSLLDKSLLRQEEGPNEEPRFVMLETIHEFAREKLGESAEAEEIKRVHAEYFLTLAEEAYPELKGPDQLEWLERLEAEHDNMRAALSWASERKEVEVFLRMGGALSWFWLVRGYHSEGRRWLEEALAMEGRRSRESRAMALAGAGALAEEQGDLDRAQEACEEGLELLANEAREASEAKLFLLDRLGWVALRSEEYGQATELFEESLALSREMSDSWWLATSLSNLASVSGFRGDSERATELYEQSMDLFRVQRDKQGLAYCLNNLAMVVCSQGQGDLGRAAQLTEESVALQRELGTRGGVSMGLCNLGWMALLQDDLGRAADLYRESLTLSWDTGLNMYVQSALEGFACVAGAKGEVERAARLWGAAQALCETESFSRDPDFLAEADARTSAVRLGMGEEAWEAALRKGRAMTLDEAVSYALEEEARG